MRPKELNYPPNPDYGRGVCRRRVAIVVADRIVQAHLSDNFHEMRCTVAHDGKTIVGVEAQTIRIPTSVCPAAAKQLCAFIGLPIDVPRRHFYGDGRARDHCTHLLDLTVVAIRHAAATAGSVIYDATVPDELDAPVAISILRNDILVHEWIVRDGVIVAPSTLAGRTLDKGFAAWASEAFEEEEFEAATLLARTWLIAVGRRYRIADAAGRPIATNPQMFDRCYAYSLAHRGHAVFTGEPDRGGPA